MKAKLVPCRAWERQIQLHAAGVLELEEGARRELEDHLDQCPACQGLSLHARRLARSLERIALRVEDEAVPGTLGNRWRGAIRERRRPVAFGSWVLEVARWMGGCLPGGRAAWLSVAACWLLVALLRITVSTVEAPVSGSAVLPLGQVLSVLRTDSREKGTVPGSDLLGRPRNNGAAVAGGQPEDIV